MGRFNVITISRTYGSGGKGIAKRLAEELGFSFWDKGIVRLASERSNLPEDLFDEDRLVKTSLLYSMALNMHVGQNLPSNYHAALNDDRLFSVQSDVIREKAEEGNCIFVGRCAGYVLRKMPNALHVYLDADLDYRIDQIQQRFELSRDAARKKVQKMDKTRRSYYSYYTNHTWGDVNDYHMCLNISKLGEKGTARLIEKFIELAE